nr:MAG TPA: hypothetical protein [Caudoviricetes sp.]
MSVSTPGRWKNSRRCFSARPASATMSGPRSGRSRAFLTRRSCGTARRPA